MIALTGAANFILNDMLTKLRLAFFSSAFLLAAS